MLLTQKPDDIFPPLVNKNRKDPQKILPFLSIDKFGIST